MTIKKRKIDYYSSLWNEDILYEIVKFILNIKDFIHLAETCHNIYNCLLNNEITLNLLFKNYKFEKLPEVIPNYLKNYLKYLHIVTLDKENELQFFTKIEYLTLSSVFCIKNKTLQHFKNLKKFNISNCIVFKLDFKHLQNTLQYLNISSTNLRDKDIECLQNLTYLNINYCKNITGDCLQNFTKLTKLKATNLQKIKENSLQNLQNLKYLNLSNSNNITGTCLKYFTHLEILKINNIPKLELKYLENLPKSLTILKIKDLGYINKDYKNNFIKLPNKNLTSLSISGCGILGEELQHLENLTKLNINKCFYINENFIKNLKKLKFLKCDNTNICKESLNLEM